MGNCLKNLVIAAAGDFGPGKGPEQLRKWVEANGGRWMPKVQKGITHLIAEKGAWKRGVDAVKQAKQMPGVWIVDYNWLEDSLQARRKLAERKYTWEVQRKQRKLSKTIKRLGPQADTKKFREGCAKAFEDTGSGTSSGSTIPPRTRRGVFASALEDLREKREAREREALARREAKAAAAAQGTSCNGDAAPTHSIFRDPGLEALRQAKLNSSSSLNQTPIRTQRKTNGKLGRLRPSQPSPSKPVATSELETDKPTASLSSQLSSTKAPSSPSHSHLPSSTAAPTKPQKLTDLYHVYMDPAGFSYDLEFIRRNPILTTFAKYDLRLYESNTKPHVYCTFVRYTPPSTSQKVEMKVSSAANVVVSGSGRSDGGFRDVSSSVLKSFPPAGDGGMNNTPAMNVTAEATPKMTPEEAQRAHLEAIIAPAVITANPSTYSTTPTPPSPNAPFKTLLAPPNSTYEEAFRAFRYAFREISLLSWEERKEDPFAIHPSDTNGNPGEPVQNHNFSTQRLRAQAFNIEPFIWNNRPIPGASYGVFPSLPYPLPSSPPTATLPPSTPYPPLPALTTPLSPTSGPYGSLLVREAAAQRAQAEALEQKQRERLAKERQEKARQRHKQRYQATKPLFNGINGPPARSTSMGRSSYTPPSSSPLSSPLHRGTSQSPAPGGASPGNGFGNGLGNTAPKRNPAVFTYFPPRKARPFWDR